MKSINSRPVYALLLATALSAGFVALGSVTANAQVSPANGNYNWFTRGRTNDAWSGGNAYAAVPAAHVRYQGALNARAEAVDGARYAGRDPDPNVRLQLRRSEGLFNR